MREPEHLRHVAEVLEHLCAHAQGQHALGVDPADAGLRLQIDVVDERRAIGVLDDDVGAPEPFDDVAASQVPAPEDVAAVVHRRSVRGERRERVVDPGNLRVLDLDEVGGPGGDLRCLGRDGGDRLALEAHAAVGQHGLGGEDGAGGGLGHAPRQFHAELVARHVARGEYRDHAGQGARGLRVEPDEARRRVGAPNDAAVEHAGQRQVARVDRPAAHFFPRVGPRLAPADHAIGHPALDSGDSRHRTAGATTSRECR